MTVLFRNWQWYDYKILQNLNICVIRAKLWILFSLVDKLQRILEDFLFYYCDPRFVASNNICANILQLFELIRINIISCLSFTLMLNLVFKNYGCFLPLLTFALISVPGLLNWWNRCALTYPTAHTDKKITKFSSYIRKSRREQLQSHKWLTASLYMTKYMRISSYIKKTFIVYDFATASIWFSFYMWKIVISFFISAKSWSCLIELKGCKCTSKIEYSTT